MTASYPLCHRIVCGLTLVGALICGSSVSMLAAAEPVKAADPSTTVIDKTVKVGDTAPEFMLNALAGEQTKLSVAAAKGTVVLVVLRGWPGYQCPACDRQVQEFIGSAAAFTEAKAQVIFVYPGPADGLVAHAKEFSELKGKQWPKEFQLLLDPDYAMTNAYGLRWDAKGETAYPSTFVLDQKRVVRFAKISKGHGDRSKAADVLAELRKPATK
ncbi:MAG: peroxiredoxin family protein [Planctomycetota bacterium]